ncbi:MAG: very short patch repair endonuclease [Vallitaleaceae bacterium]|nr:very short patch repair endonuclease [Vallitaleaceae bacterium]
MSNYIRDGRSPLPENEVTSKVMSKIKGKNTKPELLMRKAMWNNGIRGYRIHWSKVPGRPDIAFPGKKIAIFVNGCFWHRCPNCNPPTPKTHTAFWEEKFSRNKERDEKKIISLQDHGWEVLVLWECEIKENIDQCISKIHNIIGKYESN